MFPARSRGFSRHCPHGDPASIVDGYGRTLSQGTPAYRRTSSACRLASDFLLIAPSTKIVSTDSLEITCELSGHRYNLWFKVTGENVNDSFSDLAGHLYRCSIMS